MLGLCSRFNVNFCDSPWCIISSLLSWFGVDVDLD